MITPELFEKAQETILRIGAAEGVIATAESCTGGMISAALTAVPGASAVVDRGFTTYSNDAKIEMLGVDPELITTMGAVSDPVARQMAEGALARSQASIAVAVTGVAGPGQSESKPAGLVYIACATERGCVCQEHRFDGVRSAVRFQAVIAALELLVKQN